MKTIYWILVSLVSSTMVFGQQPFGLDQAIETALKKNQLIQSAESQVAYFKEIRKTSSDMGKLSAQWMHGQYNSLYQDNNLTFTQTLPFPTYMTSHSQYGKEQVIGAQKGLHSIQNDLVFDVKSVYHQLLYLQALRDLLQSQDSLYADFSKASSLRYKTGETGVLEKTTAETQWMEVKNQVRINGADIQIAETRLQALLKNDSPVTTTGVLAKRDLPPELDSASLSSNPQLNYLKQQVIISQRAKQVEKNRILPDISIGYFNQSLIGIQNINGQDQYFGANKRFQGFQLGLYIPLWFSPLVARAKAAALNEEALQKNADYYQTTLAGIFAQALQELDKNTASLNYYEGSALKNADLILNQAQKAYRAGEIGYIEYLQSLRNAVAIKSSYLQALNQYNQSIIKVEYLIGKF